MRSKPALAVAITGIYILVSCSNNFTKNSEHKPISIKRYTNNSTYNADFKLIQSLQTTGIVIDTGSPYNNYVVIKAQHLANIKNRKNSYEIDVYAKFTSNGSVVNAGPLYVNNRTILANASKLYRYNYKDSSLFEGKSLYGTSASVDIPGINEPSSSFVAASTLSARTIVVPKEIYPTSISLPSSELDRSVNFPLTWQADPNNQYHKVQITVTYYMGLSQYNIVGMPNSIPNLYYTVADNGSFVIPQADLSRYPKGSYICISIARASYLSSSNRVVYIGISEAHTIPLLVIDNISCDLSRNISGPNPLCGSSIYSLVSSIAPNANAVWTATPSGIVTITGKGPNVTVSKITGGNVILSTTVANCNNNGTQTISKTIIVGPPTINISYSSGACNSSGYQTWSLNASSPNSVTNWQWTVDNPSSGSWYIDNPNSPSTLVDIKGGGGISVTATNACGSTKNGVTIWSNCPQIAAISASPNPTSDNVTIAITERNDISSLTKNKAVIYQLKVTDQFGNEKKRYKYSSGVTNAVISLSGLISGAYTIQAFDGTSWSSAKVIKQ